MEKARLSMGDILVPEERGIRGRGTFLSQSLHTCPVPHTPGLSVTPKPSSGPGFSVTDVPRVWAQLFRDPVIGVRNGEEP